MRNSDKVHSYGKKVVRHSFKGPDGITQKVDVRMDYRGRFSAEYLDVWYQGETLKEVQAKLAEAAKNAAPTVWTFYIEVDEVDYREDPEYSRHYTSNRAKISLSAHWRAVSVTNPLKDPEKAGATYRLVRTVEVVSGVPRADEDDDPTRYTERETRWLVPFTRERWEGLEQLARSAEALGRRLAETLNPKTPEALARSLDVMHEEATSGIALIQEVRPVLAPMMPKKARR